jgi:hypothetical protein
MTSLFTEKDWKTLRGIHDELLWKLCDRINKECATILASRDGSSHERYLRLYKHIQESDSIIGDCFNDLKRANIHIKMMYMKREGLLTEEHLQGFSQGARAYLGKRFLKVLSEHG